MSKLRNYPISLAVTIVGLAASALALYDKLATPEEMAAQEFFSQRPAAVAVAEPIERPNLVVEEPATGPNIPESAEPNLPEPNEPPEKQLNMFVKTALEEYKKHQHLPYVWGGESPYPLEETRKDPFFDGVSITETQPTGSWRKNQKTRPGFDCSGWIWYIGKKAGMKPFTDVRAGAEGYRTNPNTEKIWDGKYTEEMEENMEPGDLLFVMRGKKAKHIAIYMGNGEIMECSGREVPNYNDIPSGQWQEWRDYARPEDHGKTDWDRGGLQISPITKYSDKIVSVRRF